MSRSSVGGAGLALFFLIAVVPVAASLLYAFLYTVGATGLLSRGLTLSSWKSVLTSTEILGSFGISLWVATVTVASATAGGLAIALFLRHHISRGPLSLAIHLPLALPWLVAGFVGFQVLAPVGVLSRLFVRTGLIGSMNAFPRVTHDTFFLGVILVHVFLALPFFTLLFHQLINSERIDDYVALSKTLGATSGQTFRRVVAPILLTKARTNILLFFVVVLGSYEIPLLLGRQHPSMISVLTVRKYYRFDLTQKPQAFAIAILYTVVAVAVIVLALRGRTPEVSK